MKIISLLILALFFCIHTNGQNTITNTGNFSIFQNGSVTIFGDFNQSGSLIVNGGATLTSNGVFTFSGGTISDTGTFVYGPSSSLIYNDMSMQTSGTELPNENGPVTVILNNAAGILLSSNTVINNLIFTSGKLNLNNKNLLLNGAVTNTSGSFIGSKIANMTIAGTAGTLYFDQTSASTASLNNLAINSNASATLGAALNQYGTMTVNGTLNLNNQSLVLKSDSSGTASIANITGTITNAGNVTAERYISAQGRRFRFLSSPCAGITLADWQNEIHITGIGGSINGFDNTASNQTSVYAYHETIITGDLNSGWTAATDITNTVEVGKGYRVFVRGPRTDAGLLDGTNTVQNEVTMNVVGQINMGDIMMNPTFTSSGTLANDGWNLLGNPYPSGYDWNAFHTAGRNGTSPDYNGANYSHIDATVYVYDATANSYKSYNAVAESGTLTDGIIPSGAAFFIKASALAPAITFKEAFKTETKARGLHKMPTNELHIKLIADSNDYDSYILKLMTGSTKLKDGLDIVKIKNDNTNLSSYGYDGIELTLSSYPAIDGSDIIPLTVYADHKFCTLEFNNVDNFALGTSLFLKDNFAKKITDIRLNHSYVFTIDTTEKASFGNKRFELIFDTLTTGIVENQRGLGAKVTIYPNPVSDALNVRTTIVTPCLYHWTIYGINGQVIEAGTCNNELQTISTTHLAKGFYLFELQFENFRQVLKFVK